MLAAAAIEEEDDEAYYDDKLVFLKQHDRFAEEGQLLMSNSTFFITPIGIVETTKTLVLPFLAFAKNLADHLQSLIHPSSLASEAVAYITWRLASAIAHLHARGIAHTKLCSQRVLVTSNLDIKLCGLSSHTTSATDALLTADVQALLDVLRQLLTRATELQRGSSFAISAPSAWLFHLAANASEYTSISDVVHELERHNAQHGVVYVNDHHGARLSVAKVVTPSEDDASLQADEHIDATSGNASMPPTPATLSELWATYAIAALDSGLLSCTAKVEGTDGNVLLRRGVYNGKDVVIHRMDYTADAEFTQHVARVLWAQSDLYTPRVLGHAFVNSDKIADAFFQQVQETVPCLVVDHDGLLPLHRVLAEHWLYAGSLKWQQRIQCARSIVAGLADFAARGITHVDITSHSVCIKSDLRTPQFTNIGALQSGGHNAFRWLPPELANGGVGPTSGTVFTFGSLLYEIASNQVPHQDVDKIVALERLRDVGGVSGDCPVRLVDLIGDCLHDVPAERPTFQAVLHRLDRLLGPSALEAASSGVLALRAFWTNCVFVAAVDLVELDTSLLKEVGCTNLANETSWTFEGTYMSQPVLLKRPKTGNVAPTVDPFARIFAEVCLLARVQSPHVINLVGVAYFASSRPTMVLEHTSHDSSLAKLLVDDHFRDSLKDADLLHLLLGAAQGLTDVHERDWIHCDVRIENYFVDRNGQLRLGQFGAARHESDMSAPETVPTDMVPYTAPEVFESAAFSKKSDVFAFGALIAQLYDTERLYASSTLTSFAIRERVPQGLAKINVPEACPLELKALAERCLSFDSSTRPTMTDVVASLREQIANGTVAPARQYQSRFVPMLAPPAVPTIDATAPLVCSEVPLGQGAVGLVTACTYNGIACACKHFQPVKADGSLLPQHQRVRLELKFHREMEFLASLDPKYVPRFVGSVPGDLPGTFKAYLMEVVPGNDLSKELWQIKQQATFPWQERCKIALKIIQAIAYIHECGIEHLDLKSSNIMLTPENEIRLLDMGESVRTADAAGYNEVIGVGTYQWMAPEILAGRTVHATKADIYSFGIILSEIAMLVQPYSNMGFANEFVLKKNVESGVGYNAFSYSYSGGALEML
ncbi:TKL/LISK protein kinase [Saprolegnia diclina VS20]|uniref:TKL/LISK protein kinase n=1 Tax=Saprolegnia diclina (strain VS20) TaxID=1156394 RepID=T0QZ20_SAPDV|nr:TKL/LISK protein kinase [Saprolegnia diclina VS20]EQC24978.1 TKL/LISK protein kinase [Saprolegnia diclina VS20]|eukprot:XP_008621583.1 TKL/LISK protein kinase [Saprolegnia diclina VS20]